MKFNKDFLQKKRFEIEILFLGIFISSMHLFNYFEYNYDADSLIRCCVIFSVTLLTFFTGKLVFYIQSLIGGIVLMHIDNYNNYSVFFIVMIFAQKFPKLKWFAFLLYLVDVVIVCQAHYKTAFHLAIHFAMCIGFYICVKDVSKVEEVTLILNQDEERILRQLEIEHRSIEEVDGYSKSTVLRKLDNACINNGLEKTEHSKLRERYKKLKKKQNLTL